MLVSDILHNSSAPVRNASAYRTKFEATLPDIMESFNDLYCSVTGRITAQALKERVLKVLQVWADWFLFSDAYVNGLRATFLRSGSSGVTPFHSICGDAPEIENRSSSGDITEGVKLDQDYALAMGKGAAMKELSNLPLSDLERRCRHNGLSLVGGREMMVARLLSLEENETEKSYEPDNEMRYGQLHSRSASHLKDASGWSASDIGDRDANHEIEPLMSSGWKRNGVDAKGLQGKSSASLAPTLPIPQPELKAFTLKGKSDPVLPVSKWAREDDGSDEENKRSAQGLALSYSSSGSEIGTSGPNKGDDVEVTTEVGALDSGMNEEQRCYNIAKVERLEVAVMEYRMPSQEIRDRRDESRDSSRKRSRSHSQSQSPQRKLSTRHKDKDTDVDRSRERRRDRDSSHELERQRGSESKKRGSRERDGHDRDKHREREMDRRKKGK
ncbi:hypothetical protein IFM89_018063 [Coptis chinensis]|uniref:CID domain-containing protein n=1 Tax=Coptis chinensis TaxID=261450 RepID=A0A835IA56_9MAGN|nr:hypothetical protein IFM89_018063 [Coptis chinensis]